jgi:hypothetical protein
MRLTLFALLLSLSAFSQTPADFSGTWKMDPARSESAHQTVPIGPVTLLISQTPTQITIETKTGPKDKATIANEKLTYNLDGSESANSGNSGVSVTCKAHWEGANLVTETARNLENSTVTTRYTFTLDPGAKELTLNKTLTVQHGYQGHGATNTGSAKDVFIKR